MAVQDGFNDPGIINKLENMILKETGMFPGNVFSSVTVLDFPLSDQWNTISIAMTGGKPVVLKSKKVSNDQELIQ